MPQNPSEVLTIEPILTSLKSTESFTIIELFEKVGLKVVRACLLKCLNIQVHLLTWHIQIKVLYLQPLFEI